MLVYLMLSQRSLRLSLFLLIIFSISYSVTVISTIVFQVTYLFFCLSYSAIDSLVHYSAVCLFFSSYRSLVNIYRIFSIVFPRSWIIFTIIILNSFSGRLPISTSFSCFSGVLSCPFIWDIILCIFILINFLWCGFCSGSYGIVVLGSFICPLVDEADGRDWHWEKLGLALVGRVMLSNTLIC